MNSEAYQRVVAAAQGKGLDVKEQGDRSMIQCPAHSDGRPSLSVKSIDGSVLLYCMAGCLTNDVLAGLGLSPADLFDDQQGYTYRYPGGREVRRTPDKQFYQLGDKTDTSLFGSENLTDDVVFVVEGEKDVLAIQSIGGQAVSSSNGASLKPEKNDWSPLQHKAVRIIADQDEPGRKRAQALLEHLGVIARRVVIYNPRVGKDASDHIAAGYGLDDFKPELPSDILTFSEALDAWREWKESDAIKPIPTPWLALNNKLAGGLQPGRLYVVGARTGAGKSVAGQNMVSYAVERGFPSLVVSVEMPVTEVMSRVLAAQAGVDYGSITKRDFTDTEVRIDKYIADHRHLPMYISDEPSVTIEEVAAKCRALVPAGLAVLFLDYAQLVKASDQRVARQEQVAHIVRSAKLLAMELNIAVILAAQLNRNAEDDEMDGQQGPRLPKKSDLRESGELEQSADVILLLHRSKFEGQVYCVIAKNRTGPESQVVLQERFDQARLDS